MKKNKHWCLFIVDGSQKLTWHLQLFQGEDSLRWNPTFFAKCFHYYILNQNLYIIFDIKY